MMDHAYFVGRVELLDFFNDLLDLQLAKIEQTASGAVACQLTEYIFPGSIPMQKVNWEARSDYEFIANYKLLQVAFSRNRVQRHVDVTRLIRAKYQDNLEFANGSRLSLIKPVLSGKTMMQPLFVPKEKEERNTTPSWKRLRPNLALDRSHEIEPLPLDLPKQPASQRLLPSQRLQQRPEV